MDFLYLLCNLYIIGLSVALPLYTGGTYYQIGDSKYVLFQNLSLLCLGLWIAASLVLWIRRKLRISDSLDTEQETMNPVSGERMSGRGRLGSTDFCMLLYGVSVLLSACLSKYGLTAWNGYREWYMGAVSQLIFVGIYFFVSRCYDGKRYPLILNLTAFCAVTLFGILHRLGYDALGLMKGFQTSNWEYSHMISTIGNINWFCGYYSVALALPVAGFLKSEGRRKQAVLYGISVLGLFLLFVQGSDTGVMLTGMCLLICMILGMQNRNVFRKTFLLAAGLCLMIPVYGVIASAVGERALAAFPADSIGWNVINFWGWWLAGALCMTIYCILYRFSMKSTDKAQKRMCLGILMSILFALILLVAFYLKRQPLSEAWGSGRGTLWKVAWQGFLRNGWLQKLVGVGPDCFAEYIYSTFTGDELLVLEGRWSNALYANAHNEWLNHLINLGIMGTGCYLGIFMTCAWRYRKNLLGILVIFMYGAISLTCFQQCMSTPLFFMVLGICEASLRAQGQYSLQRNMVKQPEECEFVSAKGNTASENLQTSERRTNK